MTEDVEIRIQDGPEPTLIYLPGTHGDWTLNSGFRRAIKGRARLVEFTFPRTVEWSLADYAKVIEKKLLENNITAGWVLAESFASQIAWAWVAERSQHFKINGIILAGGFVRHPIIAAVRLAKFLILNIPSPLLKTLLRVYTFYARIRGEKDFKARAEIKNFVERRTKSDLKAAAHRLTLIAESDLRPIARQTSTPVLYLTGLIDPIVPWPLVQPWLKTSCPGYQDWKLVLGCDHHVLGSAKASAQIIHQWIQRSERADTVKAFSPPPQSIK